MIFWIASYPKSGNTWLRSLLSAYFFSNDGSFNFELLKNIDSFPNASYFEKYPDEFLKPESTCKYWIKEQIKINLENKIKFFKTHNAMCKINGYSFTDKKNSLGAVYIVRDPRNIVTSLSNHYQINIDQAINFMSNEKNGIIEKRNNRFLGFNALFSWSFHEKSWSECTMFPVLIVRYEDLQNETYATFKKVIEFINKLTNCKKKFNRTKAIKTIDSCKFGKLKNLENKFGFYEAIINKSTGKKIKFFNLGKDNIYEKLLNFEQIKRINNLFKLQLEKYGY